MTFGFKINLVVLSVLFIFCQAAIADQNIGMNLQKRMEHHKVSTVSIAVIEDASIKIAKAYGHNVNQNTLFQAGSISKSLNAFGILTLVKQNKISLDEDVNKYLKHWKVKHNHYYTADQKITLRQILSHSAGFNVAGFPGYEIGKKLPSVVEVLNGKFDLVNTKPVEVIYTPGEKFQYSGGGITISQLIIEDVTGKDYASWMQNNVLIPLDMNASTFMQPLSNNMRQKAAVGHESGGKEIQGKWHIYPEKGAAGLWTTPTDLAKFVISIFKILEGCSDYPIDKKLVNELLEKQVKSSKATYSGLGVFLQGNNDTFSFGHDGKNAGFISRMIAYPQLKKGYIIMINNDADSYLMEEISNSIADTYDLPRYLND